MRQKDRKKLIEQLLPIVHEAGNAVVAIYRRGSAGVSHKTDASPVTEADLVSHRVLATHLAHLLPGCQVVSEGDSASLVHHQSAGRFWLIDPLDGTKEFIDRNGEFTVNSHEGMIVVQENDALFSRQYKRCLGEKLNGQSFFVQDRFAQCDKVFREIKPAHQACGVAPTKQSIRRVNCRD